MLSLKTLDSKDKFPPIKFSCGKILNAWILKNLKQSSLIPYEELLKYYKCSSEELSSYIYSLSQQEICQIFQDDFKEELEILAIHQKFEFEKARFSSVTYQGLSNYSATALCSKIGTAYYQQKVPAPPKAWFLGMMLKTDQNRSMFKSFKFRYFIKNKKKLTK